jgi:protein TonB
MTRPEVLDEQERMLDPLLRSLALHGLVFGLAMYAVWFERTQTERWGDPKTLGGGSVVITPVGKIPMPVRPSPRNPVASDTESETPAPPSKTAPKDSQADAEAIPLKSRTVPRTTQRERVAAQQRLERLAPANQVYSQTGQRVSSELYTERAGAGTVGSGSGSPFGNRFGYYEQLIRERLARNWKTDELDPRLQSAPPVTVSFQILRDGSVRNARIVTSSGNFLLDQSALRAVLASSPFPPLPAGFERDAALIEVWFQLKR